MKYTHINEFHDTLNFLKTEGHILSLQGHRIVSYLKVKQPEFESQLSHSITTRLTFGKLLKLLVSQFSHLQNEDSNKTHKAAVMLNNKRQ